MSAFDTLALEEQARLETAAAWWARLKDEPALELSSEFLAWVSEPKNCRALQAIETMRAALDEHKAAPTIVDMRRAALTSFRNASLKRWGPRRLFVQAAAAVLVLALAGAAAWQFIGPKTYATDVGERRVVELSDGSRIFLDSDSEVEVRYTRAARAVTLDRGRARFDVAHDVSRPFAVTAGAETVVAVGTSFDVEKLGGTVLVTLIQGHVLVKNAAGDTMHAFPRPIVPLASGQQLIAARDTPPIVAKANLDAATAWEAGHLVFLGERLGEAVQRVNRYTDHPIAVDPSAASIKVSGVFNAGDASTFVAAITAYFPIEATTSDDNTILLQRRPSATGR